MYAHTRTHTQSVRRTAAQSAIRMCERTFLGVGVGGNPVWMGWLDGGNPDYEDVDKFRRRTELNSLRCRRLALTQSSIKPTI